MSSWNSSQCGHCRMTNMLAISVFVLLMTISACKGQDETDLDLVNDLLQKVEGLTRRLTSLKKEAALIRKSMDTTEGKDVEGRGDHGKAEDIDGDFEKRQLPTAAPATSVTYVKWGNKTCPPHAEFVYEGVIGGSHIGYSGGGANYLCMSYKPTYDTPSSGAQSNRGWLYGSQYSTTDFEPFNELYQDDPPCAVCRVTSRTTSYTVPARNVCPSGWNIEYTGYMMTSKYNQYRSRFICVDENADYVFWTSYDQGSGAFLYPVEVRCVNGGSIPCSPYVDGNELTCAVCTY